MTADATTAAVTTPVAPTAAGGATTAPAGRGVPAWWLALAYLVSGALLAIAEWMAARGDASAHYYVFWLGYLAGVGPTLWLALRRGTPAAWRGALVGALGIWSLCPILLRTGSRPLFFDEFSHLRMLQDLVRAGHPVSSTGLLQIGASFPGLELVTSALAHLSGLTLWFSALSVAGLAHVALLVGVYVLVRDASGDARAGAIAAAVYSLNPSWLFFDAQFSYETLALPMLVWTLVLALRGTRVRDGAAFTRGCQLALAAVLTAGLVTTHHVTSVVSCLALLAIAVVATVQRRGLLRSTVVTSPWSAWALAALAIVLTVWRFVDVGHPLVVYLGPTFHLSQQLRQLLGLLGIGPGLPVHGAFANSSAPLFEEACAYLMLPVLLVAFVGASWGLVGLRARLSPLAYPAVVLGALFFVSLPLASAAAYAEAVHRSWAFSFLGLAACLGIAGGAACDGRVTLRVRRRVLFPVARLRDALAPLVAVSLAVVAIGGVSVGTSTSYRFGGPAAAETDPLYVGTQTSMVAAWFARHTTASDVVWANRFVVRPIAVASSVHVVTPGGTEVLLVLSKNVPSGALWAFVRQHVTYIVYDRRTGHAGHAAAWTFYVSLDTLLPKDARTHVYGWRIGCLDWAHAVFATTDYEVLKVDRTRLADDLEQHQPTLLANCGPKAAS